MTTQLKAKLFTTLTHPQAKTVFILGTIVVAAFVGGAPFDFGGDSGR
jgi:hypothetical protein